MFSSETQQEPNTVYEVYNDEVAVDAILGSGAYSTVYKVRMISMAGEEATFDSADEGALSLSSRSSSSSAARQTYYALKKLHGKTTECHESAARDLLSEASLLAMLPRHENIVALHAVSVNFWYKPSTGYIVLDYLPETLESRIATWHREQRKKTVDGSKRMMQVCLPVARALAFLHRHDICYRDLKPENIGFDVHGTIRLYDFGFARQVQTSKLTLKKRVGTPRYMAPEVMKKELYGKPADIYSLAVMMWEVLTLKKPYDRATSFDHLIEMVADQHIRPSCWSTRWKEAKALISRSWHKDQTKRPSADQVVVDLTKACRSALKKTSSSASTSKVNPVKLSLAPRAA